MTDRNFIKVNNIFITIMNLLRKFSQNLTRKIDEYLDYTNILSFIGGGSDA